MSLIAYGLIALALIGALSGVGYKIRESGKDAVRVEWAADVAARKAEAEAERMRQDALRQAQDKQATRRLADARKSNAALLTSLDAHIRVARLPADCRITDLLLGDANRALAGDEGSGPGTVPSSAKPAAVAR